MFGWREVYISTSKENFEQAKQKLANNKVKYKVKIKDDNLRLSMNNLDGRQGAALSRGGGSFNVYYYIYVKKENEEYSKKCIGA